MRQNGSTLSGTIEKLKAIGATGPVWPIDAEVIEEALKVAREQEFHEFKTAEQAWLSDELGPLSLMLTRAFEMAIQERGPEVANAQLMGSLLGSSIIRSLIDANNISIEDCRAKLSIANISQLAVKTEYDVEIGAEESAYLFGQAAAGALSQIKSPIARTWCATTLSVVMWNPAAMSSST